MSSKVINGISYTSTATSDAKFVKISNESETPLSENQDLINARSYNLSERNGANSYIVSVAAEEVFLNFIPRKINVADQDIHEFIQPQFEFFVEEIEDAITSFTLADGIIYRCVSPSDVPLPKESYTYYIIINGMSKLIPNYKTLEVMLAERNQTLVSVRVLEFSQCKDFIIDPVSIINKTDAWKSEYEDQTSIEKLRELENNAIEAEVLVEEIKETVERQIAAVIAQSDAQIAEAEAAKLAAEVELAKLNANNL